MERQKRVDISLELIWIDQMKANLIDFKTNLESKNKFYKNNIQYVKTKLHNLKYAIESMEAGLELNN